MILVEKLRKFALRKQVQFHHSWIFERQAHWSSIQFSCFHNNSNEKGRGGIILFMVLRLADHLRVPVLLFTNEPRLYSWYESFGFTEYKPMIRNRRYYIYYPNLKEYS